MLKMIFMEIIVYKLQTDYLENILKKKLKIIQFSHLI